VSRYGPRARVADLDVADADARALAEAFKKLEGRLFGEVRVWPPLLNGEAGRKAVVDGLGRFARGERRPRPQQAGGRRLLRAREGGRRAIRLPAPRLRGGERLHHQLEGYVKDRVSELTGQRQRVVLERDPGIDLQRIPIAVRRR
jgi:hypothetical protein